MLIRFNVKNFLSFNKRNDGKSEEFTMIAGKVRDKSDRLYVDDNIKLLKLAAIFGANASGKTNFVRALNFFKITTVIGLSNNFNEHHCKTLVENIDKPSYFEIEIKLGSKYYSYGYEVILSKGVFVSEWLVELSKTKENIIFERTKEKGFVFGDSVIKSKGFENIKIYSDDIKDENSILFLTLMNLNKNGLYSKFKDIEVFKNVYNWIKNDFKIFYPNSSSPEIYENLNPEKIDELCRILEAFGTGINSCKREEIKFSTLLKEFPIDLNPEVYIKLEQSKRYLANTNDIKKLSYFIRNRDNLFIVNMEKENIYCERIKFFHNNKDFSFRLHEESDGTVRILDLVEILLSDDNKTYVIDELDRALHPSLTYKFIQEFTKIAKTKNIQLIVTTHESRLLDFDLVRRDEVWFVNKEENSNTHIYSLDEYNERFDKKIDKAYLEGRYGGVPIFNTVFPIGDI